jgi:hypothetical protein
MLRQQVHCAEHELHRVIATNWDAAVAYLDHRHFYSGLVFKLLRFDGQGVKRERCIVLIKKWRKGDVVISAVGKTVGISANASGEYSKQANRVYDHMPAKSRLLSMSRS